MTDIALQGVSETNQLLYQRLKLSIDLGLRRQLFLAVCDDLALRNYLAGQLEMDLADRASLSSQAPASTATQAQQDYPGFVSLNLNLDDPNPMLQIGQWLSEHPRPVAMIAGKFVRPLPIPGFQILGVERLTRQSAAVQRLFLSYLQSAERNLSALETTLVLWMPRPWMHSIRQSAPEFWCWRTGVFEFEGDPTPTLSVAAPEAHKTPQYQLASSPSPLQEEGLSDRLQPLRPGPLKEEAPSRIQPVATDLLVAADAQEGAAPPNNLWNILTQDLANFGDLNANRLDSSPFPKSQRLSRKPEQLLEAESAPPRLKDGNLKADLPLSETDLEHCWQAFAREFERSDVTEDRAIVPPADPDPEHRWQAFADDEARSLNRYDGNQPEPLSGSEDRWQAFSDEIDRAIGAGAVEVDVEAEEVSLEPVPRSQLLSGEPGNMAVSDRIAVADNAAALTQQGPDAAVAVGQGATLAPLQDRLDRTAAINPSEQQESMTEKRARVVWEAEGSDLIVQKHLHRIEESIRQGASQAEIALAYQMLGNLYRDRIEQGDNSQQNLLFAIQAYEQVLTVLGVQAKLNSSALPSIEGFQTPQSTDQSTIQNLVKQGPLSFSAATLPDMLALDANFWPDLLNDLGNLYWMLSHCPPSETEAVDYVEKGIQTYQVALLKINAQAQPQSYALVQNNLGAAYSDLAQYRDPVENLQKSILAYQEALHYRQATLDPLKYASTQNNLGTTYWNLSQHSQPAANLKQAIAAYTEALCHCSLRQDPLSYAMIQNNLGTAYWNLAQYEQPDAFLRLAIDAYQIALKYRTPATVPAACAATHNNLGTAYWHLASHAQDRPQIRQTCLQRAIAAYETTLALAREGNLGQALPLPLSFDLLATHNNLGLAYYQIANDAHFSQDEAAQTSHLEKALSHHLQALNGWQEQPELYQAAFTYAIQTIRAFYRKFGLQGQNQALSQVPSALLPEIMRRL